MALINPPLACPLTFQGAFLIGGSGTSCNQFSNTDGVTAIPYSAVLTSDLLSGFLPYIACAVFPTETLFVSATMPPCAHFIISQRSAVTVTFPLPIGTGCSPGTFRQLCVYPFVDTVTVSSIVSVDVTATGFINVPTFTTTTTVISATITVSSTSTSTITSVVLTTNTLTVGTSTETTTTTTRTITQSEDSIEITTLFTTTTTFDLTTETQVESSSVMVVSSFTFTLTSQVTTCNTQGPFALKAAGYSRSKAAYPIPYNFRVEQAQCLIPYAGSVYNSNPGSSVSTICNVAGATQLITNYAPYNDWLWTIVKSLAPCAYASTDTVLWVGSSAGNCYALSSVNLVIRPCTEIHPVICINQVNDPTDFSQFTFVSTTVTLSNTVTSVIVTSTSTIQVTRTNTQVSTVLISIPILTETTRTSTRNTLVTQTATGTRTFTGITVTTTTFVSTETDQTITNITTLFVMTRTITLSTTISTVSSIVTLTTETDTIQSCPETRARTITIESTLSTVITNIVPQYITTIYTTESKCIPFLTTTYATNCGC